MVRDTPMRGPSGVTQTAKILSGPSRRKTCVVRCFARRSSRTCAPSVPYGRQPTVIVVPSNWTGERFNMSWEHTRSELSMSGASEHLLNILFDRSGGSWYKDTKSVGRNDGLRWGGARWPEKPWHPRRYNVAGRFSGPLSPLLFSFRI